MRPSFFVTDLHGSRLRYRRLFQAIEAERPAAVFLGGDLLPGGFGLGAESDSERFLEDVLAGGFERVREALGAEAPSVFLIPGNDDLRIEEERFVAHERSGLWRYCHARPCPFDSWVIHGYACVPPTPFALKDWERYDVSRHVDPGCVSPEDGLRSVAADPNESKWGTIEKDLEALDSGCDPRQAVFLFHAPPYDTPLDRAALDGRRVDHVPLDVHVGSIAIRRFLERRQPLLSLHGHVHEAARLTGEWRIRIGATHCLGAAHDGPELALVRFDLEALEEATRELLPVE